MRSLLGTGAVAWDSGTPKKIAKSTLVPGRRWSCYLGDDDAGDDDVEDLEARLVDAERRYVEVDRKKISAWDHRVRDGDKTAKALNARSRMVGGGAERQTFFGGSAPSRSRRAPRGGRAGAFPTPRDPSARRRRVARASTPRGGRVDAVGWSRWPERTTPLVLAQV